MAYCTDNAAMIAALGGELWKAGAYSDLSLEARAGG
jgi:tRNA A37 threonylcarbamoyltransferase TsaD